MLPHSLYSGQENARVLFERKTCEEYGMKLSEFAIVRLACAYFFICPGITYGIFTSRLPALKAQTGANEAQIGLVLLCFGGASLISLFSSSWFLKKWGNRNLLLYGSITVLIAVILMGIASNPYFLGLFAMLGGLGTGFVDVSMNTQGVQIEKKYTVSCMSFMHASYSFGGVIGALSGSVFAGLGYGFLTNTVVMLGIYFLFLFKAYRYLLPEASEVKEKEDTTVNAFIPFFIIFCGVLAMIAYSCEGAVAEWGSLFMHGVKGALEQVAALVYAGFSVTTMFSRFFGDRMREYFGDMRLCAAGAVITVSGLSMALFLNGAVPALFGFALMGVGLSPMAPVLFSQAGQYSNFNVGKACAVVSIFAYSGLLFHPPLLGFIAHGYGLDKAMLVVLGMCIVLFFGMLALGKIKR